MMIDMLVRSRARAKCKDNKKKEKQEQKKRKRIQKTETKEEEKPEEETEIRKVKHKLKQKRKNTYIKNRQPTVTPLIYDFLLGRLSLSHKPLNHPSGFFSISFFHVPGVTSQLTTIRKDDNDDNCSVIVGLSAL